MSSPFFTPGPTAQSSSLAILHLRRDSLLATTLLDHDPDNQGYSEGRVTNTRFGSFPHSTLINQPWGSQVRASAVDTGSRGRRKPKEDEGLKGGGPEEVVKEAVAASSGFAHLLPPTPEAWTSSLPHRTQVVYTPDYSYILQRLRVRPGSVLIEAGAGSGSFTHAAARAVFNGYPTPTADEANLGDGGGGERRKKRRLGKVWSFEFHEQRVEKLKREIAEHGLSGIVQITHRDVYNDGFLCLNGDAQDQEESWQQKAAAVFLDLPAPWLALKHLRRHPSRLTSSVQQGQKLDPQSPTPSHPQVAFSPLDPQAPIYICTFSPCIEQVHRTVCTLREQGWLEIEMVEMAHKRIEVRRERVGLHEEGLRGVNSSAATVEEAVLRLREIGASMKEYHELENAGGGKGEEEEEEGGKGEEAEAGEDMSVDCPTPNPTVSKQRRLEGIKGALADRKLFKEGRLVHRSEPELKTHTSYLVFAVLPREWTEEDEQEATRRWPEKVEVGKKVKSARQAKRDAHARRKAAERKADERQVQAASAGADTITTS